MMTMVMRRFTIKTVKRRSRRDKDHLGERKRRNNRKGSFQEESIRNLMIRQGNTIIRE